ncbi:MAG: RHS repeat-associated core domain-containing protein, partial [Pseudomonadales bacterium]
QRYRRVDDSGQSIQTETHYVGSVEWIYKPGSVVITKRYLDGEAIATTTQSGGSVQQDLHYLLKDHLGSTDLITTAIGDIVQAQSFDAYGLRRYDDDYTALTLASRLNFDSSWTTRGFTGHEGMDPVGLVHMNGRVYDPKLGRFLSGDPFVQDPANTQSFNRYSYVLNNPLSYTDPSGYFFKKLAKGILEVAKVAVAAYGSYLVGGWNGVYAFLASSFLASVAANVPEIGAVVGAFTSGLMLTSFVGAISSAATCSSIAGGGSGCIMSLSASGTRSEETGGKFTNAAATDSMAAAIRGTTPNRGDSTETYRNPLTGALVPIQPGRDAEFAVDELRNGAIAMGALAGATVAGAIARSVYFGIGTVFYSAQQGEGPIGGLVAKLRRALTIDEAVRWTLGSGKSATKWANQMAKRGWNEKQIGEALSTKGIPARNAVNPGHPATRHVHPETGQSVVIDNKTKEVIHIGGRNFDYSDWDLLP